jgi:hypothetical protein
MDIGGSYRIFRGPAEEKGKRFFFEKKKQKTFMMLWLAVSAERVLRPKSFLVLFFKKEPLPVRACPSSSHA